MNAGLRVAYVTIGKADDLHEWSGLNAAIRRSLLQQGCRVDDVDELGAPYSSAQRARKRAQAALFGTTYALERSPAATAAWSRIVDRRIAANPPVDAIVSTGTLPVAFLDGHRPLAIWADATFHGLRSTYPDYANYSRASIKEGDSVERAALNRASLVCYASEWAADDAVEYYGISRSKTRVIPFGANAESPFANEVEAASQVAQRDWSVVRLAFIGVDWHRKGGDLAVAIADQLNQRGVRTVLSIAGCEPPPAVRALPFVESHGFLSKKAPADSARLRHILLSSHFLLVPSIAECFGLVYAEAAAFALPSVARAVGGVATAVQHGKTGLLMPLQAGAGAYCDALEPLLTDRQRYAGMCAEAYRDYAGRLNWQAAGARFCAELSDAIAVART